ncbi:MAG: hypothetical protein KF777_13945 [Planctomycetaceae bacterium]|nr:hypothetical protein [Planctomycetaceae bacterium]
MIQWLCPNCSQPLTAPDDAAGRQGECAQCDARVLVPAAGTIDASRPQWLSNPPSQPANPSSETVQQASAQSVTAMATVEAYLAAVSYWIRQRPIAAALILGVALVCYSSARWFRGPVRPAPQTVVGSFERELMDPRAEANSSDDFAGVNRAPVPAHPVPENLHANAVTQPPVEQPPKVPAAVQPLPQESTNPVISNAALNSDDYAGLAGMATQLYRQRERMVQLDPPRDVLLRLRSSTNAAVKQMTSVAEEALRQYAQGLALDEQAREGEAAAMTGFLQSAFQMGDDSYAVADTSTPGVIRIQTLSQHYFDEAVSGAASSIGYRASSEQLLTRSDLARRQLWEGLIPNAERLSGPEQAGEPVLSVEIERTSQVEFSGPFDLMMSSLKAKRLYVYRLVARNESGRELTNVTVALKLRAIQPHVRVSVAGVSDSGLAEPNHYFVPRWAAGETIQLMTGLHWGSEGLRRSHEGQLTVWSTELKQAERPIRFDANLRAYLGDVIAAANARLDKGDFASVLAEMASLESLIPDRFPALRQEVADVRKEGLASQQRHDQLGEACRAGRDYSGRWVFGKYSAPFGLRFVAPATNPPGIDKEIPEKPAVAELYDPRQPTVYRPMSVSIQPAASRRWAAILSRHDSRLGVPDRESPLPTHTNLLRSQDERTLMWQLSEDGQKFTGRSSLGDEITAFPADAAASITELLASPLQAPELLHPQSVAPVPRELLTTAYTAKPYATTHQVGELRRGRADSFYTVAQVFLARDQAVGMSLTSHSTGQLWSLESEAPGGKPIRGKAKQKAPAAPTLPTPENLETGEMAPAVTFRGVGPVAVSSDLGYLISWGDYGKVEFWETRTGRGPAVVDAGAQLLAYSDDGRELLLTASSDNQFTVRGKKGDILLKQKVAAPITAMAASRDGMVVAASSGDKLINFWSLKDQSLLGTYRAAKYSVQQLHFNADGTRALTIGWLEAPQTFSVENAPLPRVHVEILDLTTMEKRYEADLGRNARSATVSSDWRYLLLGDNDSQIYLWNLAEGREIARLVGHQHPVTAVAFSPDGRFAMSGSVDTWAIFWGLPVEADTQPAAVP